ncbi:MAG: M48 family metalloprotease [Gammaproteobacteria bacterium]
MRETHDGNVHLLWRRIRNGLGCLCIVPALLSAARAQMIPRPPPEIQHLSPEYTLPELGIPGENAISMGRLNAIGLKMYQTLKRLHLVLPDPLVQSYITHLGHLLSSHSARPTMPFHYFVMKTNQINSFAAPGNYIAIFTGIILFTHHEDELAAVLSHETAHEVQGHIARTLAAQHRQGIVGLAALAGAIALAAVSGNPNVALAAIGSAAGGFEQYEIDYLRTHESEADRVGITIMARAGFDPYGMVDVFRALAELTALNGRPPAIFLDHPTNLDRMANAAARARLLAYHPRPVDPDYALMRARVRVLVSHHLDRTLHDFEMKSRPRAPQSSLWHRLANRYGAALCWLRLGDPRSALAGIDPLEKHYPMILAFRLVKAHALLDMGRIRSAIRLDAETDQYFPENEATALDYSRALARSGDFTRAVLILDRFYGLHPHRTLILHRLAHMNARLGRHSLSDYYLAHYFVLLGSYLDAQLEMDLALKTPHLTSLERDRYHAFLTVIQQWIRRHPNQAAAQNRRSSSAGSI